MCESKGGCAGDKKEGGCCKKKEIKENIKTIREKFNLSSDAEAVKFALKMMAQASHHHPQVGAPKNDNAAGDCCSKKEGGHGHGHGHGHKHG